MSRVVFFGKAEGGTFFPGPGTFPMPVFGDACACCNAPSTKTTAVDPGDDRTFADSVAVPVCAACVEHLPRRQTFGKFKFAFFVSVLVGVAGVFALDRVLRLRDAVLVPTMFGAGLLLGVLVTTALVVARNRWLARWSQQGHFRNLSVFAGAGFCGVRTNNEPLAQRLLQGGGRAG